MNAGPENLDVTDVVTSLTFIDLPLFDYDEFQDELTSIHARLQYLSTGEQGSRCLFFPGLLWWYTITQKPEDRASSNGIWHLLNGPGAYKTMLDTFMNAQGIADVALELTNVSGGKNTASQRGSGPNNSGRTSNTQPRTQISLRPCSRAQ